MLFDMRILNFKFQAWVSLSLSFLLVATVVTSSPFTDDAKLRLRRSEWRPKLRPKTHNLIHHSYQRKPTTRYIGLIGYFG